MRSDRYCASERFPRTSDRFLRARPAWLVDVRSRTRAIVVVIAC